MEVNQCMGCQAGWPLFKGDHGEYHRLPRGAGYSGEIVGCTESRYRTPEWKLYPAMVASVPKKRENPK